MRREVFLSRPTDFTGNLLLPTIALAGLAGFALLFAFDPGLYWRVIGLWSFPQALHPFADVPYIPAEIACFAKGVNVYAACPLDPFDRPLDYSPLWLRLGFLAGLRTRINELGLIQDGIFAVSLVVLPRARSWIGVAVSCAALLSPTAVFGFERGNIDLVMFALVLAGLGVLERRDAARFAGYACFMLAGVLKFYPMVVMGRALDERPRNFAMLVAISVGVVAAMIGCFGPEIRLALGNVLTPSDFGDGFGSWQLGDGLAVLAGRPGLALPLWLAMCLASLVASARLAVRPGLAAAHAGLSAREASCLVACALIFCGCFLSHACSGYRGTVLLIGLPGLVALAQAAETAADDLDRGCGVRGGVVEFCADAPGRPAFGARTGCRPPALFRGLAGAGSDLVAGLHRAAWRADPLWGRVADIPRGADYRQGPGQPANRAGIRFLHGVNLTVPGRSGMSLVAGVAGVQRRQALRQVAFEGPGAAS